MSSIERVLALSATLAAVACTGSPDAPPPPPPSDHWRCGGPTVLRDPQQSWPSRFHARAGYGLAWLDTREGCHRLAVGSPSAPIDDREVETPYPSPVNDQIALLTAEEPPDLELTYNTDVVTIEGGGGIGNPGLGWAVFAPGDVTGDGVVDLVGANEDIDQVMVVTGPVVETPERNDWDWMMTPETPVTVNGTAATGIGCGDVDGDRQDDLCLDIGVVLGPIATDAGPTLTPDVTWTTGGNLRNVRLAAGDLDGDGHPEMVVADPSAGTVHRVADLTPGSRDLALAPTSWTLPAGARATAMAVGELTGDTDADLVVGWTGPDGDAIAVLPGTTGGDAVGVALTTTAGPSDAIAVADFDGDGQPDLAVGGGAEVKIWLGPLAGPDPGAPAVVHRGNEHPTDRFGFTVDAADVDLDGRADLAVGAPWEHYQPLEDLDPPQFLPAGRVWVLAGGGL